MPVTITQATADALAKRRDDATQAAADLQAQIDDTNDKITALQDRVTHLTGQRDRVNQLATDLDAVIGDTTVAG